MLEVYVRLSDHESREFAALVPRPHGPREFSRTISWPVVERLLDGGRVVRRRKAGEAGADPVLHRFHVSAVSRKPRGVEELCATRSQPPGIKAGGEPIRIDVNEQAVTASRLPPEWRADQLRREWTRKGHVRPDQQVANTVRGQGVGEGFGVRRRIIQDGDSRSVTELTIEFVEMKCQEPERFRERRRVWTQPARAYAELPALQDVTHRRQPHLIASVPLQPGVERPAAFLEPVKVRVSLRCADGVLDVPHARLAHTRWRVRISDVEMAPGHDEDGVDACLNMRITR